MKTVINQHGKIIDGKPREQILNIIDCDLDKIVIEGKEITITEITKNDTNTTIKVYVDYE